MIFFIVIQFFVFNCDLCKFIFALIKRICVINCHLMLLFVVILCPFLSLSSGRGYNFAIRLKTSSSDYFLSLLGLIR